MTALPVSAPSLTLRAELARKAVHLATAILPVAWGLGWVSGATVRTALAAATAVALGVEVLRRRSVAATRLFTATAGPLLRSHEVMALTGATWLAIGMTAVAWLAPPAAAIAALWAAAVGDASAALVGRGVARVRGSTSSRKSWAGSLAAVLTTAAGCVWLTPATAGVALVLGGVAALAEWPRRPLDDNLRVTVLVAVAATLLGLR